jgi:hypothetical protein
MRVLAMQAVPPQTPAVFSIPFQLLLKLWVRRWIAWAFSVGLRASNCGSNSLIFRLFQTNYDKLLQKNRLFILLDPLLFKSLSSFKLLICHNQSRRADIHYFNYEFWIKQRAIHQDTSRRAQGWCPYIRVYFTGLRTAILSLSITITLHAK